MGRQLQALPVAAFLIGCGSLCLVVASLATVADLAIRGWVSRPAALRRGRNRNMRGRMERRTSKIRAGASRRDGSSE